MNIKEYFENIDHLVARRRETGDQDLDLEILDLVVSGQTSLSLPQAAIDTLSELYAFIVDSSNGEIHSDIHNWTEAVQAVSALNANLAMIVES